MVRRRKHIARRKRTYYGPIYDHKRATHVSAMLRERGRKARAVATSEGWRVKLG